MQRIKIFLLIDFSFEEQKADTAFGFNFLVHWYHQPFLYLASIVTCSVKFVNIIRIIC